MVEKLLDIYRTMHNYVEAGRDGQTPAMRLGLKTGVVRPEDLTLEPERWSQENHGSVNAS